MEMSFEMAPKGSRMKIN